MFKSYEELKVEQEKLAAIENNMWKLPNDKFDRRLTDNNDSTYIRKISGSLPLQEEPTGTLELKEEWLEGVDLEELLKEDNES